jgi:uncharacterized protein YbdZ (MbtH family)
MFYQLFNNEQNHSCFLEFSVLSAGWQILSDAAILKKKHKGL